jgi:hypothetical protein
MSRGGGPELIGLHRLTVVETLADPEIMREGTAEHPNSIPPVRR